MSRVEGKTYLVTGSTDGIGKHTATKLAKLGAHVIIHGRNQQKIDAALEEITRITGNANLFGYNCDLSSLAETRSFAERVKSEHPKIDVLINNAAVFQKEKKITEEGYEYTWALNVLSPYLLTCLLVNSVTERIINVSSISASNTIDFENLQHEKGYNVYSAYSLSKLCVQLMTFHMAKKLKGVMPITVNTLDPGTVNTKMLYSGWGPIGIGVDEADDEFYLATDESVSDVSGKYFVRRKMTAAPSVADREEVQERLIKILQEQTGEVFSPAKI
eukprot:g6314.t1